MTPIAMINPRKDVTQLLIALLAAVAIVGLTSCRRRADQTVAGASPTTAAAGATQGGEAKAAGTIVESKNLAIKDEAFDLPFAEEKQQSYSLSPGATVRLQRINGKIEIQKSTTDSAELYIVRSVADRDDLRNRTLIVEEKPDELVIRMDRAARSKLFAIFHDNGREKQRMVLKLPRKIDLNIEGISGRISVGELDGDISIEGVNGRIALAQVAGSTSISGINGQVRVVADGRNKNALKVEGINGGVEVLFTGTVNADLHVESVHGNVDHNLPNLVYDGERRQNNFRARVGKGGAMIDISGVNGRVRLAPFTGQDVAAPVAIARER